VRVVWNSPVEGLGKDYPPEKIECAVTSEGVFQHIKHGYVILREVFSESVQGTLLYEKRSAGKWLAVQWPVVLKIELLKDVAPHVARKPRISKTLQFLPRLRLLARPKFTRTLYVF
jgi:hypothetical protein